MTTQAALLRSRKYYWLNREKILARRKIARQDPEEREYRKLYLDLNRDRINEAKRKWAKLNKDKITKARNAWKKRNQAKATEYMRAWRARRKVA